MEIEKQKFEDSENDNHHLFTAFIGKKVDKYLDAQKQFENNGLIIRWNWSAAFLGPIWLFYRKLYGYSLLYLLLLMSVLIISGSFPTVYVHASNREIIAAIYSSSEILSIIMFFGSAFFGSYLYLNKAQKTIAKYKNKGISETDLIAILQRKGNPTYTTLAIGILLTAVAIVVSILIASTLMTVARMMG